MNNPDYGNDSGGSGVSDAMDSLCVGVGGTILDALRALDAGAAEIVCVLDESRRFVGVLTDGDVRRALLGGAHLETGLQPFVNTVCLVVSPEEDRAAVLDLMRARQVAQVPVISSDGRLAGMHLLRSMLRPDPLPSSALILAGGRGTRLGDLTANTPKPMLKVAGRPILERLVLQLVGQGVGEIWLSVGYLAEQIVHHFGDGTRFGCTIRYIEDDPLQASGTGGPIARLRALGEPRQPSLLVVNGDLVADFDFRTLLSHHRASASAITIGSHLHDYEVPFGVLRCDGNLVLEVDEKPRITWPVSAGVYVLSPTALDVAGEMDEATFSMVDLVQEVLRRGLTVTNTSISGEWVDVGRPFDLSRAQGRTSP